MEEKLTLRTAFQRHLLPDLTYDRAQSTINGYRTVLARWEAVTDDPLVTEITDDTLRAWRDKLLAAGLATSTVAKHWRCVRAILRRLGPRVQGNPQGMGILVSVPYLRPSAPPVPRKRIVAADELSAVYWAADAATWPQGEYLDPPDWWRLLLVLAWTYGPRTGDLFRLVWRGESGGQWVGVDWDGSRHVAAGGHHAADGWLIYVPTKTRRHKPQVLDVPLTAAVRRHLLEITGESISNPGALLLPRSKSTRLFYTQWRELQRIAGIERPFSLQDLRKTCSTNWERLHAGLGAAVLGHAPRGVNATWYTSLEPVLVDQYRRYPQPERFKV